MTQYLGNPKVQYFDGNGNFLSGGKLYVYAAGTSTPQASYPTITDAENATNANANPVILDSRGEADVVLSGASKLVLKDSDDATIWTVDEVEQVPSSSDILDSNANTNIKITATASAVNHWESTNAATGGNVNLKASGTDTNIAGEVSSKGSDSLYLDGGTTGTVEVNASSTGDIQLRRDTYITGDLDVSATATIDGAATLSSTVAITGVTSTQEKIDIQNDKALQLNTADVLLPATAAQTGSLSLFEDTDNGTNYVRLQAASSIASNVTFTLPDADGTANQVLKTDGSGALGWGNRPGWESLGTFSVSGGVIEITSTIDSTYSTYKLVFNNVSMATNAALLYSTDNGSTYLGGSNYVYTLNVLDQAATSYAGSAGTSQIYLTNISPSGGASGVLFINDPNNAATKATVTGQLAFVNSTYLHTNLIAGELTAAAQVDAIKIAASAGTIELYGGI